MFAVTMYIVVYCADVCRTLHADNVQNAVILTIHVSLNSRTMQFERVLTFGYHKRFSSRITMVINKTHFYKHPILLSNIGTIVMRVEYVFKSLTAHIKLTRTWF